MIEGIQETIEGKVYATTSQFLWDLACEVVYHNTYEDTEWTILAVAQNQDFLCVVLMDLYSGSIYEETIELLELYYRIVSKRLQEEARELRRCRSDVANIETEILSVRCEEGSLYYSVQWTYTEGGPSWRRKHSSIENSSLSL